MTKTSIEFRRVSSDTRNSSLKGFLTKVHELADEGRLAGMNLREVCDELKWENSNTIAKVLKAHTKEELGRGMTPGQYVHQIKEAMGEDASVKSPIEKFKDFIDSKDLTDEWIPPRTNVSSKVRERLTKKFGFKSWEIMNKVFLNYVGMSITKYLDQRRVDEAKELIKQSDFLLPNIAMQCGLGSSHALSALFKVHDEDLLEFVATHRPDSKATNDDGPAPDGQ